MRFRPSLDNSWFVAVLFTAMAVVFTWPLAPNLSTKPAADLGDPLFICWVLMWTGGQTLRFLSGDWHALADYWNANIFYPEKLTLAYSEHFTGQMLQILPVFAATGNIILCYNLLFLSTFVLSGLGMYLLVRELTGKPLAGLLAGVAFAFAPYRADQLPHLQVLSSQWMPLALYGFRRYFTTLRVRPLIGASAAVVMQVWSCGYYFFFFVPVAAAYCLYELISRRLFTNRRVLISVGMAGVAALLLVLPFLLPYAELREMQNMGRREMTEIVGFSADTYAFASTSVNLRFRLINAFPRAEGQTFTGFAVLLFAMVGVVTGMLTAYRDAAARGITAGSWWRLGLGGVFLLAVASLTIGLLSMAVYGRHEVYLFGWVVRLHDGTGAFLKLAACLVIAIALLPRVRAAIAGPRGSTLGFCVVALIATALFALGPQMMAKGRFFGTGPYWLLYQYMPGFDGLRVPSRYVMVTLVFLSVIAGFGAAWLQDRLRTVGTALVVAGIAAIAVEGWVAPIRLGRPLWQGDHFAATAFDSPSASTLSVVYARLRDEPGHVVVAEFPLGEPSYDIRAVYMAGFHRKPLINGYSGFFPKSFNDRIETLGWNNPTVDPTATWRALLGAGVTHVVVHEAAFNDGKGEGISNGLRSAGATELAVSGRDRLFALK